MVLQTGVLLMGCDRQSDYDARLLAADSIVRHAPDSALTLLSAIDAHRLKTAQDRALYALLLTQARYGCYEVATSDSLINVALDYYQSHPREREKLTRALIYKAAVMEELGEPQSAMTYYKQAESTVAPDDYFNQGYIRFRLGQIYNDSYVADNVDISHFKQALRYFEMVPDSFYIIASLCQMGSAYYKSDHDSALHYLCQADALAKTLHEKQLEHFALNYIADMKMLSNIPADLDTAKTIALSVLSDSCRSSENNHFLMIAAYVLAKQGKTDSCYHYLNRVSDQELTASEQVFYDKCMAEAAISHGDVEGYQRHYEKMNNLSDSLVSSDLQNKLREVDARYDNEVLKNENLRKRVMIVALALGSLVLLSALAIVTLLFLRNRARRKQQLRDYEDTIERLHEESLQLKAQLDDNQVMNEGLKAAIRTQLDAFSQLVERHHYEYTHNPKKFSEIFRKSYSVYQPDSSFWASLSDYADSTCGGIITQTRETHPDLSEREVRFLSLCCCNLPSTVVMACMGYNDPHSLYNKKRRLAGKLGPYEKLEDYVIQFMESGLIPEQEEM